MSSVILPDSSGSVGRCGSSSGSNQESSISAADGDDDDDDWGVNEEVLRTALERRRRQSVPSPIVRRGRRRIKPVLSVTQGRVSIKQPVLLATFLMRIAWRVSRLLVWIRSSSPSGNETDLTNVMNGAHVLLNMLSAEENIGYHHWRAIYDFIVRMHVVLDRMDEEENNLTTMKLANYVESLLRSLFDSDRNVRRDIFLTMCLWKFAILKQIIPVTEIHAMREKSVVRSAIGPDIEFTLLTQLIPKIKQEILNDTESNQMLCRQTHWNFSRALGVGGKDLRDLIRRDLFIRPHGKRYPSPLTTATTLYLSYEEGPEGIDDMVDLLTSMRRELISPFFVENETKLPIIEDHHVSSSRPLLEAEIQLRLRAIQLTTDFENPVRDSMSTAKHSVSTAKDSVSTAKDSVSTDKGSVSTDKGSVSAAGKRLGRLFSVRTNAEAIERLVLDMLRCGGSLSCVVCDGRGPIEMVGAETRVKLVEEVLDLCPLSREDWIALTYLACDESVRVLFNDRRMVNDIIEDFIDRRRIPELSRCPWTMSRCGPALVLLTANGDNSKLKGQLKWTELICETDLDFYHPIDERLEEVFVPAFAQTNIKFQEAYFSDNDSEISDGVSTITAELLLKGLLKA